MGLETATYIEDLVATNPTGTDPKAEGDDHLRLLKSAIKATFPGLAGRFCRVQVKGSNYTVVLNDNTSVIECSAAITLALTAAATLGNGFSFIVEAAGGDVILDPNATETINGALTYTVKSGAVVMVYTDGTDFEVTHLRSETPSNGYVMAGDSGSSSGRIWTPFASAADNAIIGGDFSTNPWQRGTSFAAIGTGSFAADRWTWGTSSSGVVTISKSADAPSVAQAGKLATHCILVDCTTADASIAAGDFALLGQSVEGYNFLPLAQNPMVLQFWHKHTKTGTYCVAFRNTGNDRSCIVEYAQAVSDTWELATITIPASPSAGGWDYTNGAGLQMYFTLACGSTYQTTAGSWQTGNYLATANQVNGLDNTANNFRIALVDLRPGSIVLPVQSRSFSEELTLCQRYTWVWNTAGSANAWFPACGVAYNTTGEILAVGYPEKMRTTPTMTYSALGDFFISSGTVSQAPTSMLLEQANDQGGRLRTDGAGAVFTPDNAGVLLAANANARITFSAEL